MIPALDALAASGLALHTASNEPSWELEGYLATIGQRSRFSWLFGPDLVELQKGHAYYRQSCRDLAAAAQCILSDSLGGSRR